MGWIKKSNINWIEYQQFAVFRRLKSRDGWAAKWAACMSQDIVGFSDPSLCKSIDSDPIPSSDSLHLTEDFCKFRQIGTRQNGVALLKSFFEDRGCFYTKAMSSPVTAPTACSRLSPYIAFGLVSMKEIHHYTRQFQTKEAFVDRQYKTAWRQAVRSFSGRLRWHCHFIQKLEDEPSIEFSPIHSAYNTISYHDRSHLDSFERWKSGQTGYPLVDACMRALKEWGWLNFRMRAMVMSFVAHHLFLHWKQPAIYLATQFTDYEPGIHYSQCQMQSGTTGINAIRIYNPIKQGLDHDPDGVFIKKWVPELRDCPAEKVHAPWEWVSAQNKYSKPIVDESEARKFAASQLYALRRTAPFKDEAQKIVKKHASRRKAQLKPKHSMNQLSFLIKYFL